MSIVNPVGDLAKRLIRLAGYNPDVDHMAGGGEYQDEFYGLLQALCYIGARKVDDYGDFRLQDIRSYDRETWGAYWDIQRKFGRLDTQLEKLGECVHDFQAGDALPPEGVTEARLNGVIETLADQAVYCVRMIQILRRLEEKGMIPK